MKKRIPTTTAVAAAGGATTTKMANSKRISNDDVATPSHRCRNSRHLPNPLLLLLLPI